MKYINFLSLLAPVLLLFITAPVQGQHEQSKDTVAILDALFEEVTDQSPGGVLTVLKDGHIAYTKGFGMADLEHGVKITPQTIFEAGSVSKQVTAGALLLLVRDQKISLDDDVREYLPELPVYDKPVTVRHLLNHTSGLKDWGSVASIGGWPRTTRVYTQDFARDYIFRQKTLNHTPGAEYIYSNSNYTLLVTIVERVSQQSLAGFTEERIFEPLGMKNTSWRDNYRKIIPGRAVGYSKEGEEFVLNMPFENTYGHAALLTTTEDLVIWNESWLNGTIGDKDLYKMRVEKGKLLNGVEIPYAAAVFVDEFNGFTEVSHSGATAGYRAWLATYPEAELTVAYLGNDAGLSPVSIGKSVAKIYLGEEVEQKNDLSVVVLPREELEQKAGLFKSERDHETLEMLFKGKALHLGSRVLQAKSRDTLVSNGTRYVFSGDRVEVLNSGGPEVYRKVLPWEPQENDLEEYAGHFSSEEAAGKIKFEVQDGDLFAVITPSYREKLKPSFADAFYVGRNKLYEFIRSDNGQITGLKVSVPRARNVSFTKK